MSHASEHQQSLDNLSAYALGALSEEESALVESHLADCEACRAELRWMRTAVDTLPSSVPQVDPPPRLHARLMDIVTAEAELLRAAGERADRPERRAARQWWPSWRLGGAAAAVCAAVAAAVVIASSVGTATRTVPAQLAVAFRGHASASLRVSGSHAQLIVASLPAPPADHVDELWVQAPGGRPRPAGTFVVSSGAIDLTAPVRHGDHVLVTVEPGTGTEAPTTAPFLVARA